ncbi:TPM domain-containing protein [Acidovorax sp. NPDC077693]|uniref:TPM domain-containing protein n=1 Tax=unclassified Acidovorax TaxID=2684926 RepID=UPI0037C9D6C4
MPAHPLTLWHRCLRLSRHRWADGALQRAFPADVLARLTERVTASERLHTGQIRICVEAGLPLSYLWRGASARERAVAQFGKLHVWDTAGNNGVLIYLLQAEHAIEIVADRGLAGAVPADTWQRMVAAMGDAFRAGRHEEGLTRAISQVSALLQAHFPAGSAQATGHRPGNELPDRPVIGSGG